MNLDRLWNTHRCSGYTKFIYVLKYTALFDGGFVFVVAVEYYLSSIRSVLVKSMVNPFLFHSLERYCGFSLGVCVTDEISWVIFEISHTHTINAHAYTRDIYSHTGYREMIHIDIQNKR